MMTSLGSKRQAQRSQNPGECQPESRNASVLKAVEKKREFWSILKNNF